MPLNKLLNDKFLILGTDHKKNYGGREIQKKKKFIQAEMPEKTPLQTETEENIFVEVDLTFKVKCQGVS